MTEISRERRATLREWCDFCEEKGLPYPLDPADVRAFLDYADQRDEALALLREARGWCPQPETTGSDTQSPLKPKTGIRRRINALLRRLGGEK